jgi:hypothetical protein
MSVDPLVLMIIDGEGVGYSDELGKPIATPRIPTEDFPIDSVPVVL